MGKLAEAGFGQPATRLREIFAFATEPTLVVEMSDVELQRCGFSRWGQRH
jgi:hypothetical protein